MADYRDLAAALAVGMDKIPAASRLTHWLR
jgi:hypothetical protein